MNLCSLDVVAWGLTLTVGGCSLDPLPTEPGAPSDEGGLEVPVLHRGVPFPEPYAVPVFDAVRISSDGESPNFHRARAEADFGQGPFERATMIVDLATTCFPFESWSDNPPPPGENWPADCDAFDRNFEISLDPPEDAKAGPPAIELVRAITPFGGPLHLEIDITDVANGLGGEHDVEVLIPTWSDADGIVSGSAGGWNVTARIDFVPGHAPREVLAVVPLFYGEQADAAGVGPLAFSVPEGAASGRIAYRTTGHGGGPKGEGCSGPADEFCRRDHEIRIDGAAVETILPWRTDCGDLCTIAHYGPKDGGFDYCAENPCGAIVSVRASRANWCPGSVTPPFEWSTPSLGSPGGHDFEWRIPELGEGGRWRVSATYFAYGSP